MGRWAAVCAAMVLTAATTASAQERPVVYATAWSIASFAERLAGDAAEVRFAPPEGVDPSLWRPTPSEIAAHQQADLVLLAGAGFARWPGRASLPRARTVDVSRELTDYVIVTEVVTHSHGGAGEHTHEARAPELWWDFLLGAEQARATAAALERIGVDPSAELDALLADLSSLDAQAKAIAAAAPGARLIAAHPRYAYFANAYGFEITSLAWPAREDPSARDVADLVGALGGEAAGARVFLFDAPPTPEAEAAVRAVGLEPVLLPRLAEPPAEGAFVAAARAGLDALAEALSDGG